LPYCHAVICVISSFGGLLGTFTARWCVFNHRRVVAVAVDDRSEPLEVVQRAFADRGAEGIEFLESPNDPELRETATFPLLLSKVASTDPDEASFYAHTKGTSTSDDAEAVRLWRDAMYEALLQPIEVVRDGLRRYPCVGTTKMVWPAGRVPPYPTRLMHGRWMFAGAFFWLRHDQVFTRPDWHDVPKDRYGTEAWLSGLFQPEDALTLYQPWPVDVFPTPNPYVTQVHRR
jgi:hypothetical protein